MILRKNSTKRERGTTRRSGGEDCPLFQTSEPPELSEWVMGGQGPPLLFIIHGALDEKPDVTRRQARESGGQQNALSTTLPI